MEFNEWRHESVEIPLVMASKAQPAPVAPPPMMRTSKDSFFRDSICCSREGNDLLTRAAFLLVSNARTRGGKALSLDMRSHAMQAPEPNAAPKTNALRTGFAISQAFLKSMK